MMAAAGRPGSDPDALQPVALQPPTGLHYPALHTIPLTWFTEFGQVIHEAAHLGQLGTSRRPRRRCTAVDPTRLLEAFPGGVRIDDPRFGRVEGEAALIEFCKASGAGSASTMAVRARSR